ncbi:NAD(P)-dependent oxidoreductase [uncultured Tenacibaculum sp.]|uniref:NAD(P)-dependent oxidoreductase n=1 Tax=uncultured Tenacibaculum sp. TaxID=174713 RepID=UPI00261A4E8F|nr:SDR family oxidoreductase [uncultured Tenacibaculum sp.]
MKLIIFGATGTVGKHVVNQALEQGYDVTAFCRDKRKLSEVSNKKLQYFEGDVFNKKDVSEAIKGKEAVIIVLGSGKSRKSSVRSFGTKNIIEAMEENNVKRLICQSTLGTGESNNNLNFFWKYIMFGWFLKQVFLDHELQEKYVRASNLDWTIVKPSAFTDGEKTEQYLHGFPSSLKSLKLKISRADVADFILKQLRTNMYLLKSPGVSH